MSIPVSTLTGSNTINQMMYNVNTIKDLAANSAGFVANPGSSTDNAVMRFDGTSGGLAQDSSVLIADNGTLSATQSVDAGVTFLTQTNNGTAGGSGLKITAQSGTYVGKFDIAAAGALAQIGTETNHPLIILTNNTERMRIDSSGNTGIGTSSPAQFVHINRATVGDTSSLLVSNPDGTGGASAALKLGVSPEDNSVAKFAIIHERFAAYGGGDTYFCSNYDADATEVTDADAVLTIKGSTGNVGIGTSSPDGKLHVFSGSAGAVTASTLGDDFVIENTDNMGMSLLTNDTGSGYIFWGSPSDNDAAFIRGAYNSGSPYLALGISGAERVRIDSSGKVGIGTTSPSYRFQIAAGTDSLITYAGSVLNNNIFFDTQNTSTGALAAVVQRLITSDVAGTGSTSADFQKTKAGALNINNYETDSAAYTAFGVGAAERMRIDSSGRVGIGTAPAAQLHVFDSNVVGSSANDQQVNVHIQGSNGNASQFEISQLRTSAGSDWTTATTRLQQRIDSTYMGWMQFNNSGNQGIAFGTGASGTPEGVPERMRIVADGKVGIGRTPTINLLEVAGTIESTGLVSTGGASIASTLDITTNNTAFRLKDSAGTMIPTLFLSASNQLLFGTYSAPASSGDIIFMRAGTERMRLDGTGFGIGTTSPARLLHVKGDGDGIRIEDGSNADYYDIIRDDATGLLHLSGSQVGFSGYRFFVDDTTEVLAILNNGNVGIGTSSPDGKLHVAGSATVTSQPNVAAKIGVGITSDLLLGSINGNAPFIGSEGAYPLLFFVNAAERMRIDSSGNVGIGTTSPGALLDVAGNINVGASGNKNYRISTDTTAFFLFDRTNSRYPFKIEAGAYDNALVIGSSGNVGIGTTAPSTTLDVSGTARATQGMPIITEAGTAKTLALTDNGGYVRTTSGSAVTITVPLNSSVAFPTGAEIVVFQDGAGLVTFAATGGVTIKSKDSNLSLGGQYSSATLKKVDTDTWDLIGDLA
jgi:hypothetical protein